MVGAAIGAAVVVRDDSALLVAPWLAAGALVVSKRRQSTVVRLIAGGLPFAVAWTWYNDARFGAPWKVGYQNVLRLNHPFFSGLYGFVLSPGKGLILYCPLLLVAAAGTRRAWRRDRVLVVVAAGLLIGRLVFFSPYWGWYGGGGFGPRYLVPALPSLFVGLMEVLPILGRVRVVWRALAVSVAGISIAVAFTGAAVDSNRNSLAVSLGRQVQLPTASAKAFLDYLEAPRIQTIVDQHMFVWKTFPITNEAAMLVHRRNLVSLAIGRPVHKVRAGVAALVAFAGLLLLVLGQRSYRGLGDARASTNIELPRSITRPTG